MRKLIKQRRISDGFPSEKIEPILDAVLKPVAPRPEFVVELRSRLSGQVQPAKTRPNPWQYAVWIGAGLVSGVVLVVAGAKAATSLLVALGVIQQVKKVQHTPSSSLRPV